LPYVIRKNEKISDLVDRFDVPYDLIWRYNDFVANEHAVYEGRKLTLPRVHQVLPGQTYKSIGELYSVTPAYLHELNPYIDGQSVIYPGQTIFLPPG
jgi:LysM repeat protein